MQQGLVMAWGSMAEQQQQRSLSAELQELFLVALGAVPGALLRLAGGAALGRSPSVGECAGCCIARLPGWLARSTTSSALGWDWFLWIPHHLQQLDAGRDAIDQHGTNR